MTKEDTLYLEGADSSFPVVGDPIPTHAHTQHILHPHLPTRVHMHIHRHTYAHMTHTQSSMCTHTCTHRYIYMSRTYIRLLIIASDQVSLSPPKGIKKDHVCIKARSLTAGLFSPPGLSQLYSELISFTKLNSWFKCKTSPNPARQC